MRSAEVTLIIECELDERFFKPWDDLTLSEQSMFDERPTNCDGGGVMGTWCRGCHFNALLQQEINE